LEDDNKFLQWLSHQKQGDVIACYGEGAKDVKEVWIARLDSNPAAFQNLELYTQFFITWYHVSKKSGSTLKYELLTEEDLNWCENVKQVITSTNIIGAPIFVKENDHTVNNCNCIKFILFRFGLIGTYLIIKSLQLMMMVLHCKYYQIQ